MPAPPPARLLITGFGRFPGAPTNPSAVLAQRLARGLARPGTPAGPQAPDVVASACVLPTLWRETEDFTHRLDEASPDIVLMIGLAARRRHLCVETLGRNGGGVFPDAQGRRPSRRVLAPGGPSFIAGPARPAPLLHALRQAGVPARLSRDAGRYICNALAYRAYGWARANGRLAVFIHVPRPRPGLDLARMERALALVARALLAQHRAALIAAARR